MTADIVKRLEEARYRLHLLKCALRLRRYGFAFLLGSVLIWATGGQEVHSAMFFIVAGIQFAAADIISAIDGRSLQEQEK